MSFGEAADAEEDFCWEGPPDFEEMGPPEEDQPEFEPTAELDCGTVVLPTQEDIRQEDLQQGSASSPTQGSSSTELVPAARSMLAERSGATSTPPRNGQALDTASEVSTPEKFLRLRQKTQVPLSLVPMPKSPHGEAAGDVRSAASSGKVEPAQEASLPPPTGADPGSPDVLSALKAALPTLAFSEVFPTAFFWKKLNHRQQYLFVYEKARSFFVRFAGEGGSGGAAPDRKKGAGLERQRQGRKSWATLPQHVKEELFHLWATAGKAPPHVFAFVLTLYTPEKGCFTKVSGKGVLLTWILPPEVVRVPSDSLPKGISVDALTVHLRSLPPVEEVWSRMESHGQECQRAAGADDVALCLEVCPEAWAKVGVLRLHGHCFLRNNVDQLRLRDLRPHFFKGVRPHVSTSVGGMATQGSRAQGWSGFFYCCVPHKRGQLWRATTREPYTQFLVNPSWIMNLMQAGKMSINNARDLLARCGNASRWLRELDNTEAEEEKRAVREAMARAEELLRPGLSAFKRYTVVDEFQAQFGLALHRYKFLVLAGPSRLGKTVFARSLAPAGTETLEVNCAAGQEPDLRAYRLSRHGLILFDEIEAGQVVAQRKLFQACAAPVQLGCSATNCHSYEVFLWQKRLVLASNNWHTSVAGLPSEDRDWVNANSMILNVEAPMWSKE